MAKYQVVRPPLDKDFELPSRQKLLKLKVGNFVKVRFRVGKEKPERLWVTLTSTDNPDVWTGLVDNDPVGERTAKVLSAGTEVLFHPLDIIATV